MMDTSAIPAHRQGVVKYVLDRCSELYIDRKALAGIILDNWQNDKYAYRVLREIKAEFPGIDIVILHSFDDCIDVVNALDMDNHQFETIYLWSLTRARIRELVTSYTQGLKFLDEDIVTAKIVAGHRCTEYSPHPSQLSLDTQTGRTSI